MQSGKTDLNDIPISDTSLFKKIRSKSDVTGNTTIKCGVIMCHRDELQQKIATAQCKRLGYHPIVIDLPTTKDDEFASQSIKRLQETLDIEELALQLLGQSIEISYILVDANYSDIASLVPNFSLLAFMRDKLNCKNIFACSYTQNCLDTLHATEGFKDIHTTDNPTFLINEIMSQKSNQPRKHSLNM